MASTRKPPLASLAATAAARLDAVVARGASICVGYSGGRDSSVLLHLIAALAASRDWRPSALHVHHGLSPNADAWARHCEVQCARLGVPLRVERVSVDRASGLGIEAAARQARYAAYARVDARWLALAHHADDQAETLLLQLMRGAGVDGLAAMAGAGSGVDGRIVRPLLEVSRERIDTYARAHVLEWIEDESNADHRHQRNRLRQAVFPVLAAMQPAVVTNITRSAGHLADALTLLREIGAGDAASARDGAGWRLDRLQALGQVRAMNALRVVLAERGLRPPAERRLADLWRQLLEARDDAMPGMRLEGVVAYRFRGCLHLAPATVAPQVELVWNGESPWRLAPYHGAVEFTSCAAGGLDARSLRAGRVTVRPRRGGERFRPVGTAHHRTLKNLFQEAHLAPWERARRPLLYVDGVLAWVPEIGVADALAADDGAGGLLPTWRPEDSTQSCASIVKNALK